VATILSIFKVADNPIQGDSHQIKIATEASYTSRKRVVLVVPAQNDLNWQLIISLLNSA